MFYLLITIHSGSIDFGSSAVQIIDIGAIIVDY